MAKIVIEIDCNKKTCGNCQLVQYQETEVNLFCSYFGTTLKEIKKGDKAKGQRRWYYIRLPECIAAEVKTD